MNSNFADFITDFKTTLNRLFHVEHNIDELSSQRGLPVEILDGIMAHDPLSVAIPQQYGGRGSDVKDILTLLEATSYESLPLTLMFGINIGLFLGPLAKYGNSAIKQSIFQHFLEQKVMGGMMITEPGHGSDALNMTTAYSAQQDGYNINGIKHWQGLTGQAKYWLVAAKEKKEAGAAGRDIDFFVCDTAMPDQQIVVEEYFDSLGLYMIPYGRNKVHIKVPATHKLEPETTGIKMMLDILHRSRMQFPGMGIGFIKRMLDEAIAHCKKRMTGTGNLLSMDQVAFKLSKIQSAYTMCSAMCLRSSEISGPEHNLATEGLEANSIKAVVTDMMQEAAQILVQVSGANGYRISNIGGRGIMDSRPFQIFEGSNGMLYTQVADMITKLMKKQKEPHLFDFLKNFRLTAASCQHFKKDLCFMLSSSLPQRKLHDLGKIISRVVSVGYVINMAEKGFSNDLIENCITMVRQEVASLTMAFQFENKVRPIEDYLCNSSWLKFA